MHWPRLVERGRMKAPARLRLAEEGALKGVREDPLRDHGKPAAGRSLEAALRQRVGTCCARCGSSPPASACEARFRLTLGAPSTSNLRTTFSDINAGSARSAVGQSHQETVRPDSTQCRPYLLRTESRNAVAPIAAQTQLKESTPPGVNPIASVVAFHLTRSTSSVETGAAELPQDCRMNVATAAISSLFSNCPNGGMPKG